MRVLAAGAVLLAIFVAAAGTTFFFSATAQDNTGNAVVFPVEEELVVLRTATTGIRWAGYSTTTYRGNLGGYGIKTANQICNANYAGSHWASGSEIMALGTKYPWSQSAWIADFYYDVNKDCYHWSEISSSYNGDYASTQTIIAEGGTSCSTFLYIPCVYRP